MLHPNLFLRLVALCTVLAIIFFLGAKILEGNRAQTTMVKYASSLPRLKLVEEWSTSKNTFADPCGLDAVECPGE